MSSTMGCIFIKISVLIYCVMPIKRYYNYCVHYFKLYLVNVTCYEYIGSHESLILGAKFRSWANFPWFSQKRDSLF
jgi:hypothetical protein